MVLIKASPVGSSCFNASKGSNAQVTSSQPMEWAIKWISCWIFSDDVSDIGGCWWLNSPTQFEKYATVKLDHETPKFRDENKTCWNPPPQNGNEGMKKNLLKTGVQLGFIPFIPWCETSQWKKTLYSSLVENSYRNLGVPKFLGNILWQKSFSATITKLESVELLFVGEAFSLKYHLQAYQNFITASRHHLQDDDFQTPSAISISTWKRWRDYIKK